jgi:integrase
VYGATKRDVQEQLDRLRSEARAGTLPDAGGLTVGQFLDRWLAALQARVSARRHERMESLVRVHLKPRVGGVRLAKLTALHVEGLAADLRSDKVKPWAARHALDALSAALNHAVKLKLIAVNPAAGLDKPTPKKAEAVFMTTDQARLVRQVSAGMPCGPLLAAALGTGARQGELLALRWEDIDLRAGTATIRRALSQTRAGFVEKEPKTSASRRTVGLPPFAVEALTALKAERMRDGLLSAPVFCTRTGNHLNKNNVLRAFRNAVKKANAELAKVEGAKTIPVKVRFHDLRHSVASILLSGGHSLRAVSQRLGHANPALTLRVYAHCLPGDDGKLADGLSRLIG